MGNNEISGGQPPLTNRGVTHTYPGGLNVVLDWVQVTFKNIQFSWEIMQLLGLSDDHFTKSDSGLYGWKSSYETLEKEIRIFEDGKGVSGTHLLISGNGCRYFEKYSTTNWVDFFGVIQNTSVNIKRIDLAIDDFEGYYTPSKIYRKIKQKSVTSKFKKGRWIESFSMGEKYEKEGTTIYIGSPKSSIQIRVYDKKKERESKNFIVDTGVDHWVRTEIQLRDERAEGLSLMIALNHKNIGQLATGILKNYINFHVPNKYETNKSRWKICEWWTSYLGNAERISLTLNYQEPTLEKTIDWAINSWSKSMVSMFEVFSGDMDLIYKLLNNGMTKIEKRDIKKINDFKEKYGNMTFDEYLEKKKKTTQNYESLND